MFGFIVSLQHVFGGNELTNFRIAGTSLQGGVNIKVQDNKWPAANLVNSYTTAAAFGKVVFGIDERILTAVNAHTTAVELRITWTNASGNNVTINNVTLTTSYNPLKSSNTFTYANNWAVNGAHQVQVRINRVFNANNGATLTGTNVPANLYLEAEQSTERYYSFDPNYLKTYSTTTTLKHNATITTANELEVYWQHVPGAEEYDLEWTYADAYTSTYSVLSSSSNISTPFNFLNNATRIRTSENKYKISLPIERGILLYRLRPVGRRLVDNTPPFPYFGMPLVKAYEIPGAWSVPDFSAAVTLSTITSSATLYGTNINHFYSNTSTVTVPDENKNAQYSATFAEEGKKKEVVSYFDGSLRNRQTVTRNNSEGQIIVGETFYDHQGRPAVNVLPVPAYTAGASTPEKILKFYEDFNTSNVLTYTNGAPAQYSKKDFDVDMGGDCPPAANGMTTTAGASRYYSSSNPDQLGAQAYVPNADNYPFVQTLYTPDNTGRIRKQSGAGNTFRMGTGRETSNLYGAPLQAEIDELFGSEAGNAERYKKNTVIDPNGQISVSFLNKDGKVVATALAGNAPANTNSLSAPTATTKTQKFVGYGDQNYTNINKFDGSSLVFNYPIVPNVSGNYTFTYNLTIPQFTDACIPSFCYDCDYELEMTIRDECGSLVYASSPSVMPVSGTLNYSCGSPVLFSSSSMSPALTASLTSGRQYFLQKKLSITASGMDSYLAHYTSTVNNVCIKTPTYFAGQASADVDLSDCDISTCSVCVTKVNAYIALHNDVTKLPGGVNYDPNYVYITPSETTALIAKCNEACKPVSICENKFRFMLADMSPYGQYGQFDKVGNTYSATAYPLSIYNSSNWLPKSLLSVTQPSLQNLLNFQFFMGPFFSNNIDPSLLSQFLNCYSTYSATNNYASWQKPYFYNAITHSFVPTNTLIGTYHYYDDALGTNPSKVFVTWNGSVYTPSLTNNAIVKTYTNGLKYVYPEELFFLKDFIDNYKPAWARSLVHCHPEWGYFEWCDEHTKPGPGNLSSEDYDNLLRTTDQFSVALTNTLIGFAGSVTAVTDLISADPYFATGQQGALAPDPSYSSGYLSALMLYKLQNSVSSGTVVENARAVANRIHRWSTMYYSPETYTCTFGYNSMTSPTVIPGFSLSAPEITTIMNREWTTYRDLYLSAKAEVQALGSHIKAVARGTSTHCGCYNGCFGKPPFDPYNISNDYGDFAGIGIYSVGGIGPWIMSPLAVIIPTGGVNQPAQPCNWQTKAFYANKQKRFGGMQELNSTFGAEGSSPSDIGAILKQNAEYETFASTGQCPNAFRLLNFLNAMNTADIIDGGVSQVNLYLFPSFTKDLYDQVHGAQTFTDYFLTAPPSTTNNSVTYSFCPGSATATPACTLTLTGLGSASPAVSWGNIIKFGNLQFTGSNSFNVLAWADDDADPETPAQQIQLSGSSCITSTCNFPYVVCQPNQSGKDLLNLINFIKMTLANTPTASVYGGITSTVAYAFTSSVNPEYSLITPALKGPTSFSLSQNSPSLTITPNTIVLPVATYDPFVFTLNDPINFSTFSFSMTYAPGVVNAPSRLTSATYFNRLEPDEIDPCKFKMVANFVSTVAINNVTPGIVVNNTQTFAVVVDMSGGICMQLGDCAEPLPMACNNPGYKSLLETKKFLKELRADRISINALTSGSFSISGYNSLSSNLKSAIGINNTAYVVSASESQARVVTIGLGAQNTVTTCSLTLTPPPTFTSNWWDNILSFNGIMADQGTAGAFNMSLTVNLNGVTTTLSIYGQSCFKLDNCSDCVSNAVNVFTENFDRFDGVTTPATSDFSVGANVTHSYGSYTVCSAISPAGTFTSGYKSTITHVNFTTTCATSGFPDQHTPLPTGTVNIEDLDMMEVFIDYSPSNGTLNIFGPATVYQVTVPVTIGKSHKLSFWYNEYLEPSGAAGTPTQGLSLRMVANTSTIASVVLGPTSSGSQNTNRLWRKLSAIYPSATSTLLTMQIIVDPLSSNIQSSQILFDDIAVDRIDCDINPPGPAVTYSAVNECTAQLGDIATHNGERNYSYYMDSVSASFKDRYIAKCRQTLETLYGTFTDKVHHYTLYYYDQAGNLVRTVPPEGVNQVDLSVAANTTAIVSDRNNNTQTLFTGHELATKYQYNSLNQLITQSMPDHDGITGFAATPITGTAAIPSGIIGNDIDFYNNGNNGFVAGDDGSNNGSIYTTTDGGANWAPASIVGSGNVNKIQFMDNNYGFAVTSSGAVLATTNGTTWASYNVAPGFNLNCLFFYPGTVSNSYYGLIGGDNNKIYHAYFPAGGGTPGFTQVPVPTGLSFNIRAVKGYASGTQRAFLVSGSAGVVLQTSLTANGTIPVLTTVSGLLNNALTVNDLDFVITNTVGPVFKGIAAGYSSGSNGFATVFGISVSNPSLNTLSSVIFTSIPPDIRSITRADGASTPTNITDDEINLSGANGKIYRLGYTGNGINLWTSTVNPVSGGLTATINHIEHTNKTAGGSDIYAFASNGNILQGTNTGTFTILTPTAAVGLNAACITQAYNSSNPVRIAGNSGNIYQGTPVSTFSPLTNVTQLVVPKLNGISVSKDGSGVVYAVGNGGTLLKSGSNGSGWTTLSVGTNTANYNTVYAFTQTKAAIGDASGNYYLANNTNTASPLFTTLQSINKIWFVNSTVGMLVGNNTTVYKSTDGGTTYVAAAVPNTLTANLRDVHLFGSTGLIVGDGATILRSTNTGSTWSSVTSPTAIGSAALRRVFLVDNSTAYAFGDAGVAIRSTDGGQNWSVLTTGAPGSTFNAVSFNSGAAQIIAVGTGTNGNGFMMNDNNGTFSDRFYYDQLGRLIISQNAKQYNKSPKAYSFTTYDALGRITKVGEVGTSTDPKTLTNYNNVIAQTSYTNWLAAGTRTDVTITQYDNPILASNVYVQANTRKRVSGTYTDPDDNLTNGYTYANFYSYDVAGNVAAVVQGDYGLLSAYGSPYGYRLIEYKYDLVSGKVNEIVYQRSSPDELRHMYEYDADNRLTNVLTSNNGGISWKQDAKYFYYKHGPLARTELGHNKTQGIDYAYTLQGWVKGVNSSILTSTTDPGKDTQTGSNYMAGSTYTNIHQMVGGDAYGFNLYYYTNGSTYDYNAINTSKYSYTAGTSFDANPSSVSFFTSNTNALYNGNICGMQSSIPYVNVGSTNNATLYTARPQLTTYKYDQLNRINEMRAYNDFTGNGVLAANAYTGATASLGNKYRNEFTYDGNGNIATQKRYSDAGTLVDDLDYRYDVVTGGSVKKRSNKLYHIDDAGTNTAGDINDQGTFTPNTTNDLTIANTQNNYKYDEIGNLVTDNYEEILEIKWNPYGKIKSVTMNSVSVKPDLEFEYDAAGNRTKKVVKPKTSPGVVASSTAFTTSYYTRDAQGNLLAIYDRTNGSLKLLEENLYGSSRLGNLYINSTYSTMAAIYNPSAMVGTTINIKDFVSERNYEETNHLGNVLTTVSDRKLPVDVGSNGSIDYFVSDVKSTTDYYAFGAPMPGRQYQSSTGYRFGYNGKEKDDEIKGAGNSLDFGARIYDPRIGRFLSVDPWAYKYVDLSPYVYAANNPIKLIDVDGLGPGDPIKIKDATAAFKSDKKIISASITLYVDQPGEGGDRESLETNGFQHDVGHTFIKLSATYEDGSKVERIVGFYPKNNVDAENTSSDGQFKDNEAHEYDVSKMYPVTSGQLKSAIEYLDSEEGAKYDLNSKNCTTMSVNTLKKAGVKVPETIPKEWTGNILGVPLPSAKGGGLNPGDLGEDLRKQPGTNTKPGSASIDNKTPPKDESKVTKLGS